MSDTQLAPSYRLTTEHPASSYGQPVLVHGPTGTAYGPGDVFEVYPAWGWMPADDAVVRMARTARLLDDPLVVKFARLTAPATSCA